MKIGIDIGGTTITIGLVNRYNNIVLKKVIKTKIHEGSDQIIERLNRAIKYIIDKFEIRLDDISHIGIGCAGMVDRSSGTIIYSNNLKWKNVNLGNKIKEKFQLPVYIENDANCAVIGEYTVGSGKKYDSIVMLTFGTGIGGGIILNDNLYKGHDGYSNIIGHSVISVDGKQCTCGRKGCWEAYASVGALLSEANKIADKHPKSKLNEFRTKKSELNGRNLFKIIDSGDAAACDLFDRYIKYVAEGIANIINILNPQAIIIGGGISEQGELILKPLREQVSEKIYCGKSVMPIIKAAQIGNDAGIVGASCLDEF